MSNSPVSSPALTVTLLGTGTSTGVPVIGCECAVCRSSDPKNKRLRSSIVVEVKGDNGETKRILVDTTPDMRMQMLREEISQIDAVLITHTHADHIFGLDDIRQFNFRNGSSMPIYSNENTLHHLQRVFDYCFKQGQVGGGKPQLSLHQIEPFAPFEIFGVTIVPLLVIHGKLPVLAYKFGSRFAYVTDVSEIPSESRSHLTGLDTLVIDAVRYEPHPTHFGLYQALEQIEEFAPRQAYLTHLSHHFDHAVADAELPDRVALGYDGLSFSVPADKPTDKQNHDAG